MLQTDRQESDKTLRVRSSLALPLACLLVFGVPGVGMVATGLIRGPQSIVPGVFFLLLGVILFVGARLQSIELTETNLIFRELGRKRTIPLNEISAILVRQGRTSVHRVIEATHVSDKARSISMKFSFGMFHAKEIEKLLAMLVDKGVEVFEE